VLGAEFLVKLMSKRQAELGASMLLLIVLVPYFLFQIGFVYEVTGSESWSLPLSEYRMNERWLYRMGYTDDWSAFSAIWLSNIMDIKRTPVYADGVSRDAVLTTYGMIYRGHVKTLYNTTLLETNGILYLSRFNMMDEILISGGYIWNTTDFLFLNNMSKVYSNGGSEIYYINNVCN